MAEVAPPPCRVPDLTLDRARDSHLEGENGSQSKHYRPLSSFIVTSNFTVVNGPLS